MLVLTQSQQMVINVEYVDCMFIGKEIIEKKAMEELKMMLNCWKHKQDIYFIRQEKAVL